MIYFDNAATAPCLPAAWKAMEAAYRTYGSVHRSQHPYSDATTCSYERARQQVAGFINADKDEIVFTSGTTDSIEKVARMVTVGPGDEVVVTAFDHNSNYLPWLDLCKRTGARLRILAQNECRDTMTFSKNVRVVAFPHVCNVDGSSLPANRFVKAAKAVGALTVMDCAQGITCRPINAHAMEVEFLAFSGHKLGGPTGIGGLYVRDGLEKPKERGTPPVIQAIGLGEVCKHLNISIMWKVDSALWSLSNKFRNEIFKIKGVHEISNPFYAHVKSVAFTVDGFHPHDVASELGRRGICIRGGRHCNDLYHDAIDVPATCRVSFSHNNTLDEIDVFIDALSDLQEKGLFSDIR